MLINSVGQEFRLGTVGMDGSALCHDICDLSWTTQRLGAKMITHMSGSSQTNKDDLGIPGSWPGQQGELPICVAEALPQW